MTRKSFALVALVASLGLAAGAHAATYSYVGPDFSTVTGPFSTTDHDTGSFVLSAPLAANTAYFTEDICPGCTNSVGPYTITQMYTGDYDVPTPTGIYLDSFSVSDGLQTIDNSTDEYWFDGEFSFSTNNIGQVTSWNIQVNEDGVDGNPPVGEIEIDNFEVCCYAFNQFDQGVLYTKGYGYTADGVIGTFSGPGSTAPEPASWALMIIGFGAVGATLRRRGLQLA